MGRGGEDPGSGACREGGGQEWSAQFRNQRLGGGVRSDAWHRAGKVTELVVCIEPFRNYRNHCKEFPIVQSVHSVHRSHCQYLRIRKSHEHFGSAIRLLMLWLFMT